MYVKNPLISHILFDNIVLVMMKGRVLNTLRAIHYWVNALGILVDIWKVEAPNVVPMKGKKLVFVRDWLFFHFHFLCAHYNACRF